MAATIWKGHIAFGLVSFPVGCMVAARSQSISFNQLHQCDHSRVKQVLYCQAEDKPVSCSELVGGFSRRNDGRGPRPLTAPQAALPTDCVNWPHHES
jgi:DNA end-binding protein Ku